MINEIFSKNKEIEDNNYEENVRKNTNSFLESIKVEINPFIVVLAQRVKSKELKIKDLTDSQLNQMLDYYRNRFNNNTN